MKRVTERQKGMPRLNAVVNHEVYQTYYKRICECETDRVFCCHQMNHLLDVARIAYIKNLEEGLGFDKELIYVAPSRFSTCMILANLFSTDSRFRMRSQERE